MVKVNGRGLCLKDASDCLEQHVTPPINEGNSRSRGLLIRVMVYDLDMCTVRPTTVVQSPHSGDQSILTYKYL
jgi:hypothetical protein